MEVQIYEAAVWAQAVCTPASNTLATIIPASILCARFLHRSV